VRSGVFALMGGWHLVLFDQEASCQFVRIIRSVGVWVEWVEPTALVLKDLGCSFLKFLL